MAVPRSSLPLVIGGTLLFGALLFLLGLLVGINLSVPSAIGSPPARAVVAPPALPTPPPLPPLPVPLAPPAAGAAPTPAPPSPAKSGDATPPAPAAPAHAAAAAPPDAAIKPVKVKGFGYGAPPSSQPASTLRGRLLEQAGQPSAAAVAGAGADPAAKPPAAQESPGDPLVFSVSVGRFLLEDNAARRLGEARAKGFQPVVVVADPPDPAGWLTVTLGPRGDAVQAGRLAEDAAAQGFDTMLVSWLAP